MMVGDGDTGPRHQENEQGVYQEWEELEVPKKTFEHVWIEGVHFPVQNPVCLFREVVASVWPGN